MGDIQSVKILGLKSNSPPSPIKQGVPSITKKRVPDPSSQSVGTPDTINKLAESQNLQVTDEILEEGVSVHNNAIDISNLPPGIELPTPYEKTDELPEGVELPIPGFDD